MIRRHVRWCMPLILLMGMTVQVYAVALTYNASTFTESSFNEGATASTITITVAGDTYTGTIGSNFITAGKITATNVPAGMTVVAILSSATVVTVSMTGNATNHLLANSISNMTFTFEDSAFTGGNASAVVNYAKNDIDVTFFDGVILTFSGTTFTESAGNEGGTGSSFTITLSGDTFTGSNGENFAGVKVLATNVPAGLTIVATRTSATVLTVSATGNATDHANIDDVSNLTLTFQDSAFASNPASIVANDIKSTIAVDFFTGTTLTYSGYSWIESSDNEGAITMSRTITIAGDTFTGSNGDEFITAGKVIAANVPAGLTPVITRTSATILTVTMTGNATSHANANDTSLMSFTFQDSAVSGGVAAVASNDARSDLTVDFSDGIRLTYSGSTFFESAGNEGAVTTSVTITVAGDTFTNNHANFVAGGEVLVSNVPAGLTAVLNRTSSTVLTMTLTGNATSHTGADDVANLTVAFQDTAFVGNSAFVASNDTRSNLAVDFTTGVTLAYSGGTFTESAGNEGATTTTVTITVAGDTFTGTNGDNFAGTKVLVTHVPAGLTAVVTRTSTTTLDFTLTGNATSHINADDVANLTVTFQDSALTGGSATGASNDATNNLIIDFSTGITLTYSGGTFTESAGNDGGIAAPFTITLAGDTFTGSTGDNFVGSKVLVTNVPAGLTAVITRSSSTVLTVSLLGNATVHTDGDDIANLTITFQNSAFTGGSALVASNDVRSNIIVDFADGITLTYSGATFTESAANEGATATIITITVAGDTFTGTNGENFAASKVIATNVPAGLTAVVTRTSGTTLDVTLAGNATNHANANDIANLTLTFQNSAFTGNSASVSSNDIKNDLVVDFFTGVTLTYSAATFVESAANEGGSSTSITITVSGDTFTGTDGDNFAGTKVVATNVPSGMTAVVTRTSATVLTATLVGNATNHATINDISNLTLAFDDSALSGGSASAASNDAKSNLIVDFADGITLTYNSSTFIESVGNDGGTITVLTITVANDTFTGSNGNNFAGTKVLATNVPTGLTAVVTRTSSTTLEVTLTGAAINHANSDDISNLTLTFQNSAFTGGSASASSNDVKNNIVVDFFDGVTLTYSGVTFTESLGNEGATSTTVTITVAGDTFTGTDGDNFADIKVIATNVPIGLTAVITRTSSTVLTISLTGNAVNHANSDDVSNMTLTFQDIAFSTISAQVSSNDVKSNLMVDFATGVTLTYSGSTFSESADNEGAIGNTLTITIANDTFSGSNGDDFTGTKVLVTNVPAGLTAVVTRTSSTILTVSLTGNATGHLNTDDIANLTVTMQNSAFTGNSAVVASNDVKSNLIVDFTTGVILTYGSSIFTESSGNEGGTTSSVTITLTNDTFTGANGDNFAGTKVLATHVPIGLTAVVTRVSATVVTVTLTGNATSHADIHDIADMTLSFQDSAFTGGSAFTVTDDTKSNLSVDFFDGITLTYSGITFYESSDNEGATTTALTITVANDTFTGADNDIFSGSKVVATNVPAGLTAVITRTSSTVLTATLTGNATNHANADDVANVTFTFQDSALTGGSAFVASNDAKSNIEVDFSTGVTLTYSAATFTELVNSRGAIATTITITLAGDTFTGSNLDNFAGTKVLVTNVPAGLIAVVTRTSSTTLAVTLTGNADNQDNIDDISNLTITFQNSAFTGGSAFVASNNIKNTISVDFSNNVIVSVTDLDFEYDGSAHVPLVTTSPSVTYLIIYTISGGSATNTAPSAVGHYQVDISVTQAGYSGSTSASMRIYNQAGYTVGDGGGSSSSGGGKCGMGSNFALVMVLGVMGLMRVMMNSTKLYGVKASMRHLLPGLSLVVIGQAAWSEEAGGTRRDLNAASDQVSEVARTSKARSIMENAPAQPERLILGERPAPFDIAGAAPQEIPPPPPPNLLLFSLGVMPQVQEIHDFGSGSRLVDETWKSTWRLSTCAEYLIDRSPDQQFFIGFETGLMSMRGAQNRLDPVYGNDYSHQYSMVVVPLTGHIGMRWSAGDNFLFDLGAFLGTGLVYSYFTSTLTTNHSYSSSTSVWGRYSEIGLRTAAFWAVKKWVVGIDARFLQAQTMVNYSISESRDGVTIIDGTTHQRLNMNGFTINFVAGVRF